jgi:hypothetical protein
LSGTLLHFADLDFYRSVAHGLAFLPCLGLSIAEFVAAWVRALLKIPVSRQRHRFARTSP